MAEKKTHPLKIWRVLCQMTQEQLGKAINRSGVAVGRYEAWAIPDPETVHRIYLLSAGQVGPNDFYRLPAIPAGRKQKEAKKRGK